MLLYLCLNQKLRANSNKLKNLNLDDAETRLKQFFFIVFLLKHMIGTALLCYFS